MRTKRIAFLGVMSSFALALAYLELLLPPVTAAFPGMKIGLANIVVIFILYKIGIREAVAVSFLRVAVAALLFGSVMSFAYSFTGALISLVLMIVLKRLELFSPVGVSVVGGISHNAAQILVAALLFDTPQLWYYMPFLAVSGVVSGLLIGLAGFLTLKKLEKIKF